MLSSMSASSHTSPNMSTLMQFDSIAFDVFAPVAVNYALREGYMAPTVVCRVRFEDML